MNLIKKIFQHFKKQKIKVAYLLESTSLCGGVKVVFRQAEALTKMGHEVTVMSEEISPEWFDGKVFFIRKNPFSADIDKSFDFLILTSPLLVIFHFHHSKSTKLFHFTQGYEGDYSEAVNFIDKIEEAYRLPVVKLTIQERLTIRLQKMFPGTYFTIGQGLENQFFFTTSTRNKQLNPINIFLIGPLSISIKHIETGLQAFLLAQQKRPDLELIRISQENTIQKEEKIMGAINKYFVSISPKEVGQVLRDNPGILISPSDSGEGFGLPALEAMACGVPTVLTDISSYRSFSSPMNYAKFVRQGSAESMAKGVLEILDNPYERSRLISRGLEVASEYTYEKVAKNLENVLLKHLS